ncbi:MAG: hypothetical protein IPG67_17445 [Acidobacteria bacterium]|nr:hypothetical protein [Acidobacteriota bacterium]
MDKPKLSRGRLLASAGKGLGLMAILSPSITSLYKNVKDAGLGVDHLSPLEAATHEEYCAEISKAFTISRSNINPNMVGPARARRWFPEAYVRYKHQEDATSSTMWQLLEPQAETIRAGLANLFG